MEQWIAGEEIKKGDPVLLGANGKVYNAPRPPEKVGFMDLLIGEFHKIRNCSSYGCNCRVLADLAIAEVKKMMLEIKNEIDVSWYECWQELLNRLDGKELKL